MSSVVRGSDSSSVLIDGDRVADCGVLVVLHPYPKFERVRQFKCGLASLHTTLMGGPSAEKVELGLVKRATLPSRRIPGPTFL